MHTFKVYSLFRNVFYQKIKFGKGVQYKKYWNRRAYIKTKSNWSLILFWHDQCTITLENYLSKPTKSNICILCVYYVCAAKDIYKNVNWRIFVIISKHKLPKCSSLVKWIIKMWHSHIFIHWNTVQWQKQIVATNKT